MVPLLFVVVLPLALKVYFVPVGFEAGLNAGTKRLVGWPEVLMPVTVPVVAPTLVTAVPGVAVTPVTAVPGVAVTPVTAVPVVGVTLAAAVPVVGVTLATAVPVMSWRATPAPVKNDPDVVVVFTLVKALPTVGVTAVTAVPVCPVTPFTTLVRVVLRPAPVRNDPGVVCRPVTAAAIVGVTPVTTVTPGSPLTSLTTLAKVDVTPVTQVTADAEDNSAALRPPTVNVAKMRRKTKPLRGPVSRKQRMPTNQSAAWVVGAFTRTPLANKQLQSYQRPARPVVDALDGLTISFHSD
jgi:hypothetical protein